MPLSLLPVLVSLLLLVWTAPASAGLLFATWTEPTQNTDGSALTNLHHYRLYYGPNAASVTPCQIAPAFQDVNAVQAAPPANSVTGADITGVTAGTTYFVSMTAVNSAGGESACSTVVSGLARANGTTVLVTLVTGSGTVSGEGSYPVGTVVTPIATPNAGFVLSSWTGGGCSGAGACHITLSTNQFVRATFVPGTPPVPPSGLGFGPSDQLLLTASVAGPGTITGSGILCGVGNTPDCTQHYAPSTTVPLTATPDAGQLHLGWANACSGIGGCSVLMDSAKSVSATFGTITDPGQPQVGTPTVGPTSASYPVTWDPSIVQPLGTPVTLYQYNGGYSDPAGVIYATTPTPSVDLVLTNRTAAECLAIQGVVGGCNAYLCAQGQFGAGGALSPNQSCQGFFVPAVAPSVLVETFPTNGPITSAQDLPWTNFGNLSVAGGDAVTTPPGGGGNAVDRARANVDLATSDQYAEATVVFTPSSGLSAAGVLARFDSAGENGYAFFVDTFDGTNYFAGLRQTIAGGDFEIGTDVNVTSHMLATNVFSIVVSGTSPNIRVEGYVNGVLVDTATGQTLYDGNTRTGIMFYSHPGGSASDARITHFAAQDLTTTTAAASCQQSDVAAAIVKTLDGGTVSIPAGDCTWTSNLTISKRVQIVGAGDGTGATRGCGSCTTIIRDNRNQADLGFPTFAPHQIFVWNVPSTGLSTISNIAWYGGGWTGGVNTSNQNGIIAFNGNGSHKLFRMHHMTFYPYNTAGFRIDNLFGVIDHNSFHLFAPFTFPDGKTGQPAAYEYLTSYQAAGTAGDNSWTQPSTMGTDVALYWEDNDFLFAPVNLFHFANDSFGGTRSVYRHNYYLNTQGGNGHGTDSGGRTYRSFRHHEVYENDWLFEVGQQNPASATGFRGGTGAMFNNRVVVQPGAGLNQIADMGVDRAGFSNHYETFGRCGQYNVSLTSSGNIATATRTNPDGDGNGHGFNLSGSSTVYVQIPNATNSGYVGTWQVVTPAPFGETFQFATTASNLPDATGVMQSPWDQNSDATGHLCLDQAGAGQSNPLNDAAPVWPNQQQEPIYYWNNTLDRGDGNGPQFSPIVGLDGADALVEGRDYFNSSSTSILKPGYAPLIYPHPLVAPPPTITALNWDFAGAQVHIPSTLGAPGCPSPPCATGSDLWPFTVDSNGTLYAAYGDGGGANGTNTVCRTGFGMHTVTGAAPTYSFANTWGCKSDGTGCGDGSFTHDNNCNAGSGGSMALSGIPDGLVAIDTTLYGLTTFTGAPRTSTLVSSTDGGHSWTTASWNFPQSVAGQFAPSAFVQYGAGLAGQSYLYLIGGKVSDVTHVYLARVPVGSVMTQGAWEWFTGTSSAPTWGTLASATPIFTDPTSTGDGVSTGGSMQFFSPLNQYIFIPRTGQMQQMHVYAGLSPWGPWTSVYSNDTWGSYGTTVSLPVHIIPSSISADGLTFWMSFSGNSSPVNWDNLSLIKGTFTVTP